MSSLSLPSAPVDYAEFYVGNARQSALYYINVFGFLPLAYAGPATGVNDRVSYVVRRQGITFVFTSSLGANSLLSDHIRRHGDSFRIIAYRSADAAGDWLTYTQKGYSCYLAPKFMHEDSRKVVLSGVNYHEQKIILFVERGDYTGVFLPGYKTWDLPCLTAFETQLCNVGYPGENFLLLYSADHTVSIAQLKSRGVEFDVHFNTVAEDRNGFYFRISPNPVYADGL